MSLTNPPLRQPGLAEKVAATYPGQAHWAGTGPADTYCGKCVHFGGDGWHPGPCRKFEKIMRAGVRKGARIPKHKIPASARSCRYYEAKK